MNGYFINDIYFIVELCVDGELHNTMHWLQRYSEWHVMCLSDFCCPAGSSYPEKTVPMHLLYWWPKNNAVSLQLTVNPWSNQLYNILFYIPTLVLSGCQSGCGVGERGIKDLFPVWDRANDVNIIIANGGVNWFSNPFPNSGYVAYSCIYLTTNKPFEKNNFTTKSL